MSKTVHMIPGLSTVDKGSLEWLEKEFKEEGYKVMWHSRGWVGPIRARLSTRRVVQSLLNKFKKGDVLVGFSNGCLAAYESVMEGLKPSAVILVQPALRRDTQWPEGDYRILCTFNKKDYVVGMSRVWGRSADFLWRIKFRLPIKRHGWGAAGRHGFDVSQSEDLRITQYDTANDFVSPVTGHRVLKNEKLVRDIVRWTKLVHRYGVYS